jgi:hypothetical protein
VNATPSQRIPRIFHFVYGLRRQTEPFHLVHYLCLESCLRVNRPDRLLFHYHHEPWGEYWDLVRDRIQLVRVPRPGFLKGYRYADRHVAKYRYAHESDFIRLDVLIEHGGVYADIDTLFIKPVPDSLFDKVFVLVKEDDVVDMTSGQVRSSLCNAFIMSAPDAEFGLLWRRNLTKAFDGSWSRHSTLLPADLALERPELIHIEPAYTVYPFMWTRENLRRLLEGCEPVDAGALSLHLWAHLWWEEQRRDFSNFYAGLMTEGHIGTVDTTFNVLARPFLPLAPRSIKPWRRLAHLLAATRAHTGSLGVRIAARIRREMGTRSDPGATP